MCRDVFFYINPIEHSLKTPQNLEIELVLLKVQTHPMLFCRAAWPPGQTGEFCKFFFNLFRAAPEVHRGSEAKDQIGAVTASLHHSHSLTGSELRLYPTPQLTAMSDP